MKYEKINRELFIKNRAKFIAQMAPKSIAIFNSNDIYPISADSTMPFQQHRDIFYLTLKSLINLSSRVSTVVLARVCSFVFK